MQVTVAIHTWYGGAACRSVSTEKAQAGVGYIIRRAAGVEAWRGGVHAGCATSYGGHQREWKYGGAACRSGSMEEPQAGVGHMEGLCRPAWRQSKQQLKTPHPISQSGRPSVYICASLQLCAICLLLLVLQQRHPAAVSRTQPCPECPSILSPCSCCPSPPLQLCLIA
mgnify:CR=1 FL=1